MRLFCLQVRKEICAANFARQASKQRETELRESPPMDGASTSSQSGIQNLPYEFVRHILVKFTDHEARTMAYLVCRGWRHQLWEGRRYHWRQANLVHGRRRADWVRTIARAAIVRGHPGIGLWLLGNMAHALPNDPFACSELCALMATVYAHDPNTQKALRASGWRWTTGTAYGAVTQGDAHVIDEVLNDCGAGEREIWRALAYNGDVDRLCGLFDRGVGVATDDEVVGLAFYKGHTDLFEWLLAHGASVDRIKERVASQRWFHVTLLSGVEWAVTRGFINMDMKTVGKFASRDRLDVVQWAHTNKGVLLDCVVLRKAVRGGQPAIATWLLDQGVGANPQAVRECCRCLIRTIDADDTVLKMVIKRLLDADIGGLCDQDFDAPLGATVSSPYDGCWNAYGVRRIQPRQRPKGRAGHWTFGLGRWGSFGVLCTIGCRLRLVPSCGVWHLVAARLAADPNQTRPRTTVASAGRSLVARAWHVFASVTGRQTKKETTKRSRARSLWHRRRSIREAWCSVLGGGRRAKTKTELAGRRAGGPHSLRDPIGT
ncbi:hypothetical protein pneo_cds_744 [Pandoravirus neocaledonia]|uniref:Ankyrin repeat domain containing protein n=1 Tax=Pandoravirus neocaledonia TaxID=2107708 RepID=A0A2U7UD09_9VIRU|nr:hypothetical protein pneo_cds_744 [Pandoravirus neocaledonia]AVK76351.1 hypothetical protein pneo_cds_744 [Pandoravirus neocaledonia]